MVKPIYQFKRFAPCVLIVTGNYFTVDYLNSYYDTQFATVEECQQWSQEHGCNGYYDTISDTHHLF